MGNSHVRGLNPGSGDTGTGGNKHPLNRLNWFPKRRKKLRTYNQLLEGDDRFNSYAPSEKFDEASNRGEAVNRVERPLDNNLSINSNNNTTRTEAGKILLNEVAVSQSTYSNRGVNTGELSINYNVARPSNQADIFIRAIRNWIPGAAHVEGILLRRRLHRAIPYVSGTTLGFSKLTNELDEGISWLRPRRKVEHWMKFRSRCSASHNSTLLNTQLNSCSAGRCENVPNEKDGWWRYTMFISEDPLDKSRIRRGLNEHGGYLVGLESRFGCEIKFTKKIYVHRATLVRIVVIDGPSKIAILKCKSALPAVLRKDLIQDYENCLINEPKSLAQRLDIVNVSLPPGVKVN